MTDGVCRACGDVRPLADMAQIDELRYCHPGWWSMPTCYQRAQHAETADILVCSDATHTQLEQAGLRALAMGQTYRAAVRDVLAPTFVELDAARGDRNACRGALTRLVEATGRLTATDGSSEALLDVIAARAHACVILRIEQR